MVNKVITFGSINRSDWLNKVALVHQRYNKFGMGEKVTFSFEPSVIPQKFLPFHFVTLACLIQFLNDRGWVACLSTANESMFHYLFRELRFQDYWSGGKNHVDAPFTDDIFNLWRIKEDEMDAFANNVHHYFKGLYADRDLSSIQLCLSESFYNVFDHADAKDNAFVFLKYQKKDSILHAAIADFGKGICNSVREFSKEHLNDVTALKKAIEYHFTVKSTDRNKGYGLSTIIDNSDTARIFSGSALFVKTDKSRKFYKTSFSFYGTLIYFEVDLSKTETEEIIDTFNF